MKMFVGFVVLFVCLPVLAQQHGPASVRETAPVVVDDVPSLKLQIAQKDLVIAQQAKQIIAQTVQLKMLERAFMGHDGEDAMNQAAATVEHAQQAVAAAQAAVKKDAKK